MPVFKIIRRHRWTIILVMVFVVYMGIRVLSFNDDLNKLKAEEELNANTIAELQIEIDDLEDRLKDSESIENIEKIAREKLQMVKPNEIVYIIQDKKDDEDD